MAAHAVKDKRRSSQNKAGDEYSQRVIDAWHYRIEEGASWREVAEKFGWESESGARSAIERMMERQSALLEERVRMNSARSRMARFSGLTLKAYSEIEDPKERCKLAPDVNHAVRTEQEALGNIRSGGPNINVTQAQGGEAPASGFLPQSAQEGELEEILARGYETVHRRRAGNLTTSRRGARRVDPPEK